VVDFTDDYLTAGTGKNLPAPAAIPSAHPHLRTFSLRSPPAQPRHRITYRPFQEFSKTFHRALINVVHGFPRHLAEADAMNQSQRARLAGRDRGQRRITHVTRGIAAGGGLTAAVIAVVLAQGPASASTASIPTESGPAQSPGSGSPSAAQDPGPPSPAPLYGQPAGDQALQPPAVAPSHSHGSRSHTRSGAS
jgi:hypothetical protein